MIKFSIGGVEFDIDSLEDLEGLAANSPTIFKSYKSIEQAALAAEVFSQPKPSTPDVPKNTSSAPGGVPECPHGPMKDCRGMKTKAGAAYKFAYYCAADSNDGTKCVPAGRDS